MKYLRKIIALALTAAAVLSLCVGASALSLEEFMLPSTVKDFAYASAGTSVEDVRGYVSYENIFNTANKHNLDNVGNQYGLYTTLTKAAFAEDDTLTDIDGVYDKNGDLNLVRWELEQTKVTSSNDIIKTESGNLFVGSKTVFFIYLNYQDGTYNVISCTGISKLPTLSVASGTEPYGVVNCYGVPAATAEDNDLDAKVVVFELDIGPDGTGLPQKGVASWVYVYNVDSAAANYCQTVYGIGVKGELRTMYFDCYNGAIDRTDGVGKWYAYSTSKEATCKAHTSHVLLATGSDWASGLNESSVYTYTYNLGVWNVDTLDSYHNGGWDITFMPAADLSVTQKWADFSGTKFYMYCSNVTNSEKNKIFAASYDKLTATDSVYKRTASNKKYTWTMIYSVNSDDTLKAVAVIIRNDDSITLTEFNRLAGVYGVS